MWAHSWLDVDDFGADGHFLSFAISFKLNSFKTDFFLAAKIKLLKRAFACNRQILKSGSEGIEESSLLLEGAELLAVLVEGHCKRISSPKKLFKNFISISLELVAGFESIFFVWDSVFH